MELQLIGLPVAIVYKLSGAISSSPHPQTIVPYSMRKFLKWSMSRNLRNTLLSFG